MTFKDLLASDLFAAFYSPEEFAEPAIYNGKEILAVEDGGLSRTTNVPGVLVPALSIRIMAADVPSPKPGDKITMRNATWYVSTPSLSEGGEWLIELDRETRMVGV